MLFLFIFYSYFCCSSFCFHYYLLSYVLPPYLSYKTTPQIFNWIEIRQLDTPFNQLNLIMLKSFIVGRLYVSNIGFYFVVVLSPDVCYYKFLLKRRVNCFPILECSSILHDGHKPFRKIFLTNSTSYMCYQC